MHQDTAVTQLHNPAWVAEFQCEPTVKGLVYEQTRVPKTWIGITKEEREIDRESERESEGWISKELNTAHLSTSCHTAASATTKHLQAPRSQNTLTHKSVQGQRSLISKCIRGSEFSHQHSYGRIYFFIFLWSRCHSQTLVCRQTRSPQEY